MPYKTDKEIIEEYKKKLDARYRLAERQYPEAVPPDSVPYNEEQQKFFMDMFVSEIKRNREDFFDESFYAGLRAMAGQVDLSPVAKQAEELGIENARARLKRVTEMMTHAAIMVGYPDVASFARAVLKRLEE